MHPFALFGVRLRQWPPDCAFSCRAACSLFRCTFCSDAITWVTAACCQKSRLGGPAAGLYIRAAGAPAPYRHSSALLLPSCPACLGLNQGWVIRGLGRSRMR
eukprot:226502-Pelagomonas_calceolata.AAC.1